VARDELADRVAAALAGWRDRPTVIAPHGRSSRDIEAELASLPAMPTGDLMPDPAVRGAAHELELATEAERAIAQAAARPSPAASPRPARRLGLAAAGLLLLGSVAAFVVGVPLVAALLGIAAVGAGGWAIVTGRGSTSTGAADPLAAQAAARRTDAARTAVGEALRARGVEPGSDLEVAVADYEAACRMRNEIAAAAGAGEALRRELDAAQGAERLAVDAARRAADAESGLRAAWAAVEPEAGPPEPAEVVVERLVAWQGTRRAQAKAAGLAIREHEELAALLGGRSLDDLEREAAQLAEGASALAASVDPNTTEDQTDDEAAAVAEVERLREAAASLAGAAEVRQAELTDVAGAEEAVAAARRRLDQVSELAGLVDETLALLEAAQRRVHRDLAPMLAAAIREWLPVLSGGAYVEAGVNPADLSIEVKEGATGAWRQARLLSEGTREQIYLLLRIAMAQHLVTTSETAPLLLDEVTAQADADRRRAILDMLLALAAGRQLVMFTHDETVLAWAEAHLGGTSHRIVRLNGRSAAPAPTPSGSVPVGSGT
jgi:ABC-type iron transport system FetAB ATPase subunit